MYDVRINPDSKVVGLPDEGILIEQLAPRALISSAGFHAPQDQRSPGTRRMAPRRAARRDVSLAFEGDLGIGGHIERNGFALHQRHRR